MSETALRNAGDTYRRDLVREREQEKSEYQEIELSEYSEEVERREAAEEQEMARIRDLLENDPLQLLREKYSEKGMTCEHEIPAPKAGEHFKVGRGLYAYANGRGSHEDFMMTYQGRERVEINQNLTGQRLRNIYYIGDGGSYFRVPDYIALSSGGLMSLKEAQQMIKGLQELTR